MVVIGALLGLALAQGSPLLDRPLPALELAHPLQGRGWSPADLRGRVVVLEIFQLGCPSCWSNALPAAQALADRHARDDRVAVVAIATAFEKERYPWMADESKIRRELESKGYTFPVMRDRDERSVRICGLADRYGTPMALVLDGEGVVRWHGFDSTAESAAEIGKTVERLLESLWVEAIPDLPREFSTYAKGDYPKSLALARRILADEDADAARRALAETVVKNLEAGAARMVNESRLAREQGYPTRARTRLEQVTKLFAGLPPAVEAAAGLLALKKDAAFARELAVEKSLLAALEALERPNASRGAVRDQLEALAERCVGSPVAPRVERALSWLR